MKILLCLILLVAGLGDIAADTPDAREVGILILKAVPSYPQSATWFVSIQWVDKDSGYVIAKDGTKTVFLNDAVGRVIYFDQGYYEEVDHNQYWVDWRMVMRARELVMLPIQATSLRPEDLPRLASEQSALEDAIERYSVGTSLVAPLIETLKDQQAKLANGMILQNGNWISAKDAVADTAAVPIVGDSESPVTFTTKDGKKFENVKVTVTDTGVSVLTSDGGASVSFDQLPDNLSAFPKTARDKIADWRSKNPEPLADEAASTASTIPGTALSWWEKVEQFVHHAVTSTWNYIASFSSSSSGSSTTPAPVAAPTNQPPAPPPTPH